MTVMVNQEKQALVDELMKRKQQLEQAGAGPAIVADWVEDVSKLIAQIRGWLKGMGTQGLLTHKRADKELSEELLGEYRCPGLEIRTVDRQTIRIEPQARFVVGANGRVDMTNGRLTVLLLRERSGEWSIAESRPAVKRVPLDEASFFKALHSLIR
jgi:hypothetical protein